MFLFFMYCDRAFIVALLIGLWNRLSFISRHHLFSWRLLVHLWRKKFPNVLIVGDRIGNILKSWSRGYFIRNTFEFFKCNCRSLKDRAINILWFKPFLIVYLRHIKDFRENLIILNCCSCCLLMLRVDRCLCKNRFD